MVWGVGGDCERHTQGAVLNVWFGTEGGGEIWEGLTQGGVLAMWFRTERGGGRLSQGKGAYSVVED